MSRHVTYRFWLFLSLGIGGVAASLIAKSVTPLAFSAPFLAALVVSVADGWWPTASVAAATLSQRRAIEGDEVELTIRLTTDGAVPLMDVEVQIPAAMEARGPTRFVFALRAERELVVPLRVIRLGVTGPEWITVTSYDRLGVTQLVRHVAVAERVRVHPHTERLMSLVPLAETRTAIGDHRSRRRGSGTELAEVRPYRDGEPLRRIHGRLSSRRGEPMVVDRHVDESADVVIYVDSVQDIGVDIETTLRWTITAANALTERHLRSMDRVGIIDRGAGVRWLPPRLGRRALHVIVDALLATSVLHPRHSDLRAVPYEHLPAGASIFAITPLLSAVVQHDLLALRRRGHEVVVIRPESFAYGHNASALAHRMFAVGNEIRRRQLLDVGAVVVPWDPSEPLEPSIRRVGHRIGRLRPAS